jgi:hypothetical protein
MVLQFTGRMEGHFLCGRDFLFPIIKISEESPIVGANPCGKCSVKTYKKEGVVINPSL